MRLQRQAEDTSTRQTRQAANAARMAKARAAEDTPARAARQANNAARTEEARAAEDTPTRAARQVNNAARTREARAAEDTPTRAARRANNAARTEEARAAEDTPARAARQVNNAERTREARAAENTPTRAARRANNATRTAESRAFMDTPTRVTRRAADAARIAFARTLEDSPTRDARRQTNAIRESARRSRETPRRLEGAALRGDHVQRLDIGTMSHICQHCNARLWTWEGKNGLRTSLNATTVQFSLCCREGNVRLPPIPNPPPYLWHLLTEDTRNAKDFRLNIRSYNNALSFSSQGAKHDTTLASNVRGPGAYAYRIQGAAYHRIATGLLPPRAEADGSNASFAEIYIYDPQVQARRRSTFFPDANVEILEDLFQLLQTHNKFVQDYRTHFEDLRQLEVAPTQNFELRLVARQPTTTTRQYNAPTSDEIGGILPGDGTESSGIRSVTLRKRQDVTEDGQAVLQYVSQLCGEYDPLRYVLLLPHGTAGWDSKNVVVTSVAEDGDVQFGNGNTSTCDWYRYHLMVRPNDFESLKRGGRLTQEYLVDQAAKVEEFRLSYFRQHQQLFRVWDAQGLQDQLRADNFNRSGTSIILPASFIGGPRFMKKLYQDAMAVVRCMGKPTYFITMTCNPKWPEIQRELLDSQLAVDRPDLVARVFRLKMAALVEDLTKKHVLGKCIAYTFSVEFQKRGLPHMHFLLIVHPEAKPRNSDQLDKIISAELPNPDEEPELYEIVTKTMLHGPCGPTHRQATCMQGEGDQRSCSKEYPKDFRSQTVMEDDSFPLYRRRNNGQTFQRDGFTFDNRRVVPYNKWLSRKYNCHINTEYVSTHMAVKYVFKYVLKGHDRTTATIERDEIRRYIDARYIGASEGTWRLLKFPLHGQYPPVQALAIHLENMQRVYVVEEDGSGEPQLPLDPSNLADSKTTLTEWFRYNRETPETSASPHRRYLYVDFPKYFTWNKTTKKWRLRKNTCQSIGRMHFVSPIDVERYHLRMLLHHVRGARSFEEVRTFEDRIYPTFKEAAQARGLLRTDNEYSNVLQEAATHLLGNQLIDLFAIMVQTNSISDPEALLEAHIDDLVDGIRRERPNASEPVWRNALYCVIQKRLQAVGSTFQQYFPNLPSPQFDLYDFSLQATLDQFDTDDVRNLATRQKNQLNVDQRRAFDSITIAVNDEGAPRSRVFFLDGPGGSGKTFLYTTLLATFRGERKHCIAVASSGIAALLLPGGTTAHSKFKIPLNCKVSIINVVLYIVLCKSFCY